MSNKNPFSDFFNTWSSAIPGANGSYDFDKAINSSKLNAKALSDAAKASAESAQAILRRQAEVLQKASEDASKYWKDVSAPGKSQEANVAKQAEYAKKSIESAIANSKEIFEMASKSNAEAGDIIAKRISDSLSEFSEKSKKKKEAA